jgi:hypothetical protein
VHELAPDLRVTRAEEGIPSLPPGRPVAQDPLVGRRTTLTRLVCALALAGVLAAAPAAATQAASSTQKRAERAVVRALVHQHGVGTTAKARCRRESRARWSCGYAAVPRSRRAVYAGRATVNRRLRVSLGRQLCTGRGCRK